MSTVPTESTARTMSTAPTVSTVPTESTVPTVSTALTVPTAPTMLHIPTLVRKAPPGAANAGGCPPMQATTAIAFRNTEWLMMANAHA